MNSSYFTRIQFDKFMPRIATPLLLLACGGIITSCVVNPYATTNRLYKRQARALVHPLRALPMQPDSLPPTSYSVGTINFNLRKPNYVIIHHTAQHSTEQTLKTFTVTRSQVSAHYVIGRDGQAYHMLNDYLRAWHGGVARWGSDTDINSNSIGIELDNDGMEPFAEAQITALLKVLSNLKRTYNIPAANFIGHGDIAPTRKNDPSALFPWQKLADHGFGLWYDATVLTDTIAAPFAADSLVDVSSRLTPQLALRVIGYDTRDLSAAISAFKRHFTGVQTGTEMTEQDRRILFNLYRKCL
jgi:N-acetylmuramoyl-L-alanine amidase